MEEGARGEKGVGGVQREGLRRARAYLEGEEDDVCLALQPDDRAALLDRLHRVLDLVEPPLRAPRRNVVVVLVAELRHADERRVQG